MPLNGTGTHTEEEGGLDWSELFTHAKPFLMGAVAIITIGIKVIEIHKLLHTVDLSSQKEER